MKIARKAYRYIKLDHNPLTHQIPFWLAIIIPLVAFLFLGTFAWIDSSPRFDHIGFNNFLERSKLPIAILALSIPLTVLVTAIHRSIQTAKQIDETETKNKADLYYLHKKFFLEQTKEIETFEYPHKLYAIIYSASTSHNNDLRISDYFENLISTTIEKINKELTTNSNIFDKIRSFHTINAEFYKSLSIINQDKEDPKVLFPKLIKIIKQLMDLTNIAHPLEIEKIENELPRFLQNFR